jgi:BASS family bile acid:Na+ symporter
MLATLLMTAPLPLVLGLSMRARFPEIAERIVGPIDVVAQAIGTVSLAYVVVSGFQAILSIDWIGLVAMTVVAEMALALGWFLEGGQYRTRIVLGLGSANRNIALALLIAADSFPGTAIVPGVASLGLLLLTLGLLHVGFWRWSSPRSPG